MTVFSFLLHPIQHFICFFSGFFIHTGFFQFLFKLTNIRYIFRMHFVQLILQKINLFFQRCFPICFIICRFLGIFRFLTDFKNFHQFIDSFLNQFTSVFS